MKTIGITGSMGSGKSTVREIIAKQGFSTIDADSLAKEIIKSDPATHEKIAAEFGSDVYDAAGHLLPAILAQRAFGDAAKIDKLNNIVHPRVFEKVDAAIARLEAENQKVVFVEAALFFETGWNERVDMMVAVSAPESMRIKRLQKRSGLTIEQIKARFLHQLSDREKANRADIVILNDGSRKSLKELTNQFLQELDFL
ncbi:MAG: dephospho-CoA kinase [Calditrichaeota bacterium]|nr:MAG: dephospho-CoA kinase [Calditrichota bacterium]